MGSLTSGTLIRLRVHSMLRVPMFNGLTKHKAAMDPTVFDDRWLLIFPPEPSDKKILLRYHSFSMREASRINPLFLLNRS